MFIIHYSQRSRWDTSATLHREGCGKVPFEGMPGKKRQGVKVDIDRAIRHAEDTERSETYYKVCSCAKKALQEVTQEN